MGRNRRPTEAMVAEDTGHWSKEVIAERLEQELKVEPIIDKVQPPKILKTKAMKDAFYDISDRLMGIGIFADTDCDCLARYIIARDNWEKAQKQVDEAFASGDVEKTKVASGTQDKYFKQCQDSAKALGLTIQSRCNLQLPPKKEKEVNKFDEFMQ